MTRPPTRRARHAFTLIEVIVVGVIVAVLVGVAAVGYTSVTNNSKDAATQARLHQVAKLVAAKAAAEGAGAVVYAADLSQFTAISGEVPPLAMGPDATLAANSLRVDGEPSSGPDHLSVAVSEDGTAAALALRSPTRKCAFAKLTGVRAEVGRPSIRNDCSGTAALSEPSVNAPDEVPATPLEAPQNVQATPLADYMDIRVTWSAVSGATGYRVYLDGAGSPAATVSGSTTTLQDLPEGAHSVTVRAYRTGENGPLSAATPFTVVYADNDMIAAARKTRMPAAGETLTFTTDNAAATVEAGEDQMKTQWWKVTPPRDTTVVFQTTGTNSKYKRLRVITTMDVTATGQEVIGSSVADVNGAVTLKGGVVNYIRLASTSTTNSGAFTWTMRLGPANDLIADAEPITPPAANQSVTFTPDNTYALVEPGEAGTDHHTLWWKITPPKTTTYVFQTTGTNAMYKSLRVLTSPDVTQTGSEFIGNSTTAITAPMTLTGGVTHYVRVSSNYSNQIGAFTFTLTHTPVNDLLADATAVTAPATGQTSTFDGDTTYAITEPGEAGTQTKSLWWKVTPTETGSYTITSTGTNGTYKAVRLLSTPDVTQTGTEFIGNAVTYATLTSNLTAGATYWVRFSQVSTNRTGAFTWTLKKN